MGIINNFVVESCVSGFLVYEDRRDGGLPMKWAFETPQALGKFMTEWGESLLHIDAPEDES